VSITDLAARLEAARLPEERRRGAALAALIREAEPDVVDDAADERLPLTAEQVTALLNNAPNQDPAWASHRVHTLRRLRRRIYDPLLELRPHPLTLHPNSRTIHGDNSSAATILSFYAQALTAGAAPAVTRYLTVSNLVAAGYPFLRLPWRNPDLKPALAAARAGQPERYLELVVGTAWR
jgi:hypothetical protein